MATAAIGTNILSQFSALFLCDVHTSKIQTRRKQYGRPLQDKTGKIKNLNSPSQETCSIHEFDMHQTGVLTHTSSTANRDQPFLEENVFVHDKPRWIPEDRISRYADCCQVVL